MFNNQKLFNDQSFTIFGLLHSITFDVILAVHAWNWPSQGFTLLRTCCTCSFGNSRFVRCVDDDLLLCCCQDLPVYSSVSEHALCASWIPHSHPVRPASCILRVPFSSRLIHNLECGFDVCLAFDSNRVWFYPFCQLLCLIICTNGQLLSAVSPLHSASLEVLAIPLPWPWPLPCEKRIAFVFINCGRQQWQWLQMAAKECC